MGKRAGRKPFDAFLCSPIDSVDTSKTISQPALKTGSILREIAALAKPKLSSSVVFSAAAGYLIGFEQFNLLDFAALISGGFLVVASSNAYNQIWERDVDALMDRTRSRPLPSAKLSVNQAFWAASIMGIAGLLLLYSVNRMSASFGALSLLLYVFAYTPLKRTGSFAVFVGAIPGAIPFMLGWVAARNDFDIESGTLFALQFVWQFPHFWAIAWLLHDDYAKAGYNLLPSGRKSDWSALQPLIYSFALLPLSLLPALGITGSLILSGFACIPIALAGAVMIKKAWNLFRLQDTHSARALLITSVLWLTVVQIVYVLDHLLYPLWH